jgi:hypothetical protein
LSQLDLTRFRRSENSNAQFREPVNNPSKFIKKWLHFLKFRRFINRLKIICLGY